MRSALCSAGLMLILSLSLSGQTLGTISGEVRDVSGGVVPNAKATVTNTATNTSRKTVTNNEGIYVFPSLVPGFYEVRIEHSGFSTATSTLELQVQQTARVDFALPVGPASETIEVSAAAALLTTDSATVGTVIEGRRIVGLPLNGRNFLQLVSLSPNVTYGFQTPGQAGTRQGGSRVLENISISGIRGTWNHYTSDGIENTDVNFNLYILLPSVDALQEFKVQSGIYSAEFGRSAGQVNVSTKPGTNRFHGVLSEFLRNSELDAKPMDFLGTTPAKTPFRWNQYGFTLGGPVWFPKVYSGRNRLFFMSNFEGYRDRKTTYRRGTFPTVAMRGGDFSSHVDSKGAPLPIYDPLTTCGKLSNAVCPVDSKGTKLIVRQQFPGNKIPPNRFDPVSVKLLEFWAIPNIATPVLNSNYEAPRSDTIDKDQFTLRMDFSESSNSQWFGRYSWTDESAVNPGIRLNGSTLYTRGRQYMASNTRVLSPAKVNEFRFGINTLLNTMGQELGGVRNVVEEVGLPFKYPDPDTWGIPTIAGMTGGLSGFGDGNTPFRIEDSIYQVLDNFSLVRGKHSVRFGGEYRYDRYPQIGNEAIRPIFWFNSQYTRSQILSSTGAITNVGGSSAADYLLGTPSSGDIAIALAEADFRANNLASYIDDTWRLSPKVTTHLGLRWEQFQPYRDALQNQVNLECKTSPFYMANVPDASLHPVLVRTGSGDFYEGKQFRYVKVPVARDGRLGRRLMQSDWNNLAPGFGLAYSPSDKLSVRAGFGVFYSAESGNSRFDMNRGLAGRAGRSPSPDFPTLTYQNILTGVTLPVQLPASILWGVKPNVRTSYSMMYLLNIQRQLSQNLALELGYNGALHRKLQGLQNMNPAMPGTTTSLASRRMFPEYGTLQVVQGEGTGNYNGLGVKLTRRYSHGMTGMVSYTWSKALDLTSAIRGNYADIFPQDSTCLRCDYGPSVYNTPHRLVASFLYELPFGAGEPLGNYGGLANYFIGGWELSSIVTVQSGRPQNTRSWDSAGQGLYGETRLNATGLSPYLPSGQRNANGWLNPAAFTNTVSGQFGNVGRNALIGPTTWAWDSSAMKNFRILEGHQLQFRLEAFNVANHPALAGPSPAWGSQNPTPATAFGQIRQTAVTMRELQFALRYSF